MLLGSLAYRLTVVQGLLPGRIDLDGDRKTIGSAADCDLVIKGEYVKPLHVVLERNGKDWLLRVEKDAPTLVQGEDVEEAWLKPGHVIQLGSENLIEFSSFRDRRTGEEDGTEGGPAQEQPIYKRPVFLLASVYLIAMVGLMVWLDATQGDPDSVILSHEDAKASLAATETCLQELEPLGDRNLLDVDLRMAMLDANFDAGAAYLMLQARKLGATEGPTEAELLEQIITMVDASFLNAWAYEAAGRWTAAIGEYEAIHAMVPDARCSIVGFVSDRIRAVRRAAN